MNNITSTSLKKLSYLWHWRDKIKSLEPEDIHRIADGSELLRIMLSGIDPVRLHKIKDSYYFECIRPYIISIPSHIIQGCSSSEELIHIIEHLKVPEKSKTVDEMIQDTLIEAKLNKNSRVESRKLNR